MLKRNNNRTTNPTPTKKTLDLSQTKVYEMIKAKAYKIYCDRSRTNAGGDPLSDWVKAEREVKRELGLR